MIELLQLNPTLAEPGDAIAAITAYLDLFSLNVQSPHLLDLTRSHGLPDTRLDGLTFYSDRDLEQLSNLLLQRWNSYPCNAKLERLIIADLMSKIGISWDSDPLKIWVKNRRCSFFDVDLKSLIALRSLLLKEFSR